MKILYLVQAHYLKPVVNTFKSLLKNTLHQSSHFLALDSLIKKSKQNLFLPFYHTVSDQVTTHIDELYSIRNITLFEQDLAFLKQYYTSINAHELYEQIKTGKPFDKPVFHLTFDDGLKEMITVVAPILQQLGIHATFFINSAFIDNKDLFYRYKASLLIHHFKQHVPSAEVLKEIETVFSSHGISKSNLKECLLAIDYARKNILDRIAELVGFDFSDYLKTNQPYLTTDDILKLKNMGFTIGAHSIDHPEYQYLSLQEQLHQTKESVNFIKNTFDLPYSYFSFPFSDENVSKAFFDKIYTSENPMVDLSFGISGLKKDLYANHLHRFPMEGTQLSAEKLIKTEYLYYLAKSLLNKNTISRND